MKLIVGNLKMNLTLQDITSGYIDKINLENFEKEKIIICPSYPYISLMSLNLNQQYYLGSQDVSVFNDGAHTGDVSAKQLSSMNVKYCIVGHSERRLNNIETEKNIIDKIINLQEYNIIPIICIGENNSEDKMLVLKKQLDEILPHINKEKEIIIAYEPLNSIGTGIVASISDIINSISYIKQILREYNFCEYNVLYGGSVNENNCEEILSNNIVDGILVGKSSINVEDFIKLLKKIEVLDEK